MRSTSVTLVSLTILLSARAARADSDEAPPTVHVARAKAAERTGDLRRAVEEYEAAYAATREPGLLLELAGLRERLGERRAAAEMILRALETIEDEDVREGLMRRIAALAAAPSQVTFEPAPGAAIQVDGESIGVAPVTRSFPAGNHQVVIAATGHRPWRGQVVLAYGEPARVGPQLAPDVNVPAAPPTPIAPAASVEVPPAVRLASVVLEGRWSIIPQDREGGTLDASLGIRTFGDHVELDGLAGQFGATIGTAFGVALRGYLMTGAVRPYAVMTALFGDSRAYALGLGAVCPLRTAANGGLGFEAVVQVDLLTVHDAAAEMATSAKVVVPVTLGLAVRI